MTPSLKFEVLSSKGTESVATSNFELRTPNSVRVSVIVPTRDRPALLAEALASIRALEGPDLSLEIVVGDNGGLAETAEAVQAYGARHIPVDRAGAGAARNVALQAATGEYIAFLDDDDLWLPGHLRPQLALLATRPELGAAVGQVVLTDEQRLRTGDPWPLALSDDGEVFEAFLAEYPQIGATVARVGVRETVGLFDETLLGDQDWDWHLRLARRHRIGFAPVPGVLFRQRPEGSFDELKWQRLGFMSRVFFRNMLRSGRHGPSLTQAARLYGHHRWTYYHYFRSSAVRHLAAGDRRAAWQALGRALVSSPVHAARDLMHASEPRGTVGALLFNR
jgi:glycosyltransferase involved in cell wall biosynthesis